jgi:hypothetical protein
MHVFDMLELLGQTQRSIVMFLWIQTAEAISGQQLPSLPKKNDRASSGSSPYKEPLLTFRQRVLLTPERAMSPRFLNKPPQ